ncbi:MAG: DUF2783 domain-containing protein [Nitratireductor sp.]
MSKLVLKPNLSRADDFYAALLAEHETPTRDESDAYNARLLSCCQSCWRSRCPCAGFGSSPQNNPAQLRLLPVAFRATGQKCFAYGAPSNAVQLKTEKSYGGNSD